MPAFDDITIARNGLQILPTVTVNASFTDTLVLDGDSASGFFDFTGFDALIEIETVLTGSLVSFDNTFNVVLNSGAIIGANGRISLLGTNTQIIVNAGDIDVPVLFGGGEGLIGNIGVMNGDIRMGAGNDTFINHIFDLENPDTYGSVTGPLRMGSGDDLVQNAGSMGRVFLGSGNDLYVAINPIGDDSLDFSAVNASAIIVRGGTGNDEIRGGDANDLFYGDANNDTLRGHDGDDKLVGGNGKDLLQGGNDNDRLMGNDGRDNLQGGNGDDTLNGGTGQDRINGGRGEDRLVGGSGADVFVFRGDSGEDVITDFDTGADVVNLQVVSQGAVGWYGDADVLDFVTYADGNAVLDLSGLYQTFNTFYGAEILSNADGIEITFLNVAPDSLTGDNFWTPQDALPPVEVVELL